jgi:hypothetical protein
MWLAVMGSSTEFENDQTAVGERIKKLVELPLESMSAGDLRFCLDHSYRGYEVLPKALEILEGNPLIETEYYDGDLLIALLRFSKKNHIGVEEQNRVWDILSFAKASIETLLASVLPEIEEWLSEHSV